MYPFKILPEITATLYGLYFYSVSVHFADGDIYTAVPFTRLHASFPFTCMNIHGHRNHIVAVVPRTMTASHYIPSVNELAEFIADFQNNGLLTDIKRIRHTDIIFVRCFPDNLSSAELISRIRNTAENYGSADFFVSGFFYDAPEHYKSVLENAFGNRFIDVQTILKTPVFNNTSDTVISSIAFDMLQLTPSPAELLAIRTANYPDCILSDENHFNDKGLTLIAQIILQEVHSIELQL